jgi:predicted ribosome quality control (RQC) complex YloA/Tae2 family protein
MKDYKKYKWFYTSSQMLVVGGKSASQNDLLLTKLKSTKKEYIVMHTSEPGSPFSVILEEPKKTSSQDIKETAIFTGCFSRAWRENKSSTQVDIFKLSQLSKPKSKPGLWMVKGKIKRVKVNLKLVLSKQKKILRAVPEQTAKKKDILLKVCPGKTDKTKMADEILDSIKSKNKEALLSALPAGGVSICK